MNQTGPGFNLFAVNQTQEKPSADVDDGKNFTDQENNEEKVVKEKIAVKKAKKSTTPKSEKTRTAETKIDELRKATEQKKTSSNTKKKPVTSRVQPAIDVAKTQSVTAKSERQFKMDEDKTSKRSSNNSLILFFIFAITAWILCYCSDFTTIGTWSVSIISGLYFMRFKKLFTGRSWLNGGAIIGVIVFIIQCFFSDSSIGEAYLMSLMVAIATTVTWWLFAKVLKY